MTVTSLLGSRRLGWIAGWIAVAFGVFAAIRKAWLCDDAFISFRYAENLSHGLGLVFNAGERVEGYSNFLWTLGTALGMRFGVEPETWSIVWGVFFYAATLALLLADSFQARGAPAREPDGLLPPDALAPTPIACVLAAVHHDWQVYATSGLETSLFTFLLTAGYVLGVRARWGVRGAGASGFAFALAALTRPDGVLLVPIVGLYMMWARRPRVASAVAFGTVFLVAWVPYALWKIAYYGEFFPNTYYAKSAYLPWYDQGWTYVSLYFRRYWVLALAIPVALTALVVRIAAWARRPTLTEGAELPAAPRSRVADPARGEERVQGLALALVLGLVYTLYVTRVGGDFMYARFLIPAAPFFVIAMARGVDLLLERRPAVRWAATAAAVIGVAVAPLPLHGNEWIHGIANEPSFYPAEKIALARREGLILRRYFEGLPVGMALGGSQAALAYYARPAIAIETSAGLTDRWIARQPLPHRGRVGHEKMPPVPYLIERKAHFAIHSGPGMALGLSRHIPTATMVFDGIPAQMIFWDPVLYAELERRGALCAAVPEEIDRYIAMLDRVSDEQARVMYQRIKLFYFDHVQDPERERPFLQRVERATRPSR